MDALRKKISEVSPITLVLCAVGAGVSFVVARQFWRRVVQKVPDEAIQTCKLAYNQVKLLEQINEARAANTSIVYLTIDSTVRIKGDNYSLDFNLMTKIEKKEQNKFLESKNPFLPPFQPGLHITELGEQHRLLFNKYSIYHNHVLLVTKQFEPQENKLTEADFKQVVLVQGALGGVYYYNSGVESGASQKHKHIQLLPSESRNLPFVEIVEQWLTQIQGKPEYSDVATLRNPRFNFLHGIRTLPELKDENGLALAYLIAYESLYKEVVKEPGISYNVIGTQRFMMLVPRRKERAFNEISVNSVGFAGSILFKNLQQYTQYQSTKPEALIADISFASERELDEAIAALHSSD